MVMLSYSWGTVYMLCVTKTSKKLPEHVQILFTIFMLHEKTYCVDMYARIKGFHRDAEGTLASTYIFLPL